MIAIPLHIGVFLMAVACCLFVGANLLTRSRPHVFTIWHMALLWALYFMGMGMSLSALIIRGTL